MNNYFQFASNVVGWNLYTDGKTSLSFITDGFEVGEQWIVQGDFKYFSFAQGGVAVFNNDTHSIVFDLVTMSGYKVSDNPDLK